MCDTATSVPPDEARPATVFPATAFPIRTALTAAWTAAHPTRGEMGSAAATSSGLQSATTTEPRLPRSTATFAAALDRALATAMSTSAPLSIVVDTVPGMHASVRVYASNVVPMSPTAAPQLLLGASEALDCVAVDVSLDFSRAHVGSALVSAWLKALATLHPIYRGDGGFGAASTASSAPGGTTRRLRIRLLDLRGAGMVNATLVPLCRLLESPLCRSLLHNEPRCDDHSAPDALLFSLRLDDNPYLGIVAAQRLVSTVKHLTAPPLAAVDAERSGQPSPIKGGAATAQSDKEEEEEEEGETTSRRPLRPSSSSSAAPPAIRDAMPMTTRYAISLDRTNVPDHFARRLTSLTVRR